VTAKAKKQKMKSMMAYADAEDHARLRKLLADLKPQTYGQLRRQYNLSPVFLEKQIALYPTVFEGPTELSTGKPMIRLKDGKLEAREDILMRRVLVKALKQAGANGVRLLRLYSSTRIASKDVQRLLEGLPEVAMIRKGGSDILYKWTGGEIEKSGKPEQSRIQETEQPAEPLPEPIPEQDTELELTRKKLVVLLEKTHRHLSWLANFLDPAAIRRVLVAWPDQFETEVVNLGTPDLIIRVKCSPDAAQGPPVAADVLVPSAPQVSGPSEPLEEIFSPEELESLRHKPPCAGMGSRRNGRAAIRGDRVLR
jgi:hypothetical protein